MSVTGFHRIDRMMGSGEKTSLVAPILMDDMKRFLGTLLQENNGIGLYIKLNAPVLDGEVLYQEAFVAKIRPDQCDMGELLYVTGSPMEYLVYNGMMFDHKPRIHPQIFERIG